MAENTTTAETLITAENTKPAETIVTTENTSPAETAVTVENTSPVETVENNIPAEMVENNSPAETIVVPIIEEKNEAKEKNEAEEQTKEFYGATNVVTKTVNMKHIILPLTVLSFLLSLPILFPITWLLYMRQYDCETLLDLPKLQVGIVIGLIIVFLVSNIVIKLYSRFPMPGLFLVMVPLILMLIVGLGLVGAYDMETRTIPGTPRWLKMKVYDDYNWNDIKSCIYGTTTCRELALRSYMVKSHDFATSKLSSIEYGCCVPPSRCEMEYVNATFWRKGDEALDVSNPFNRDCDLWMNNETILCYNCQACKEGFLKPLLAKWWKLGFFLIVMSVLLSVSHLLLFVSTIWEQLQGCNK